MAADRIGKFERWILIHAYKKITNDLPGDWKLSEQWKICSERDFVFRQKQKDLKYGEQDWWDRHIKHHAKYKTRLQTVLTKTEVLINYFGLKPQKWTDTQTKWRDYEDTFKTTKEYKSVLANYLRILEQMELKGLIINDYQDIKITDLGREKAVSRIGYECDIAETYEALDEFICWDRTGEKKDNQLGAD